MDIRGRFPLTRAFLGKLPEAASPGDLVAKVCAAHARGDIPSRAARDLVRYEAALLDLPAFGGSLSPLPSAEDRCVIAPHARVLDFGAALDEMLVALREGKPATPRPRRG